MKKYKALILIFAIIIVLAFVYDYYKNLNDKNEIDTTVFGEYSSSPFTVINDNMPDFDTEELEASAREEYSPLDSLGRCGVASATLGPETMPKVYEERGDISGVYPSGWEQAKYDGEWLYNRCHLIGWQLSAENDNERNLITGTRYFNVEGMLPFENMVADYIRETGNHVEYRVTPVYEGKNLVCNGVQIEAYSIEDNGEGIQFNVYCHNVQPGVVIDYKSGESHSEKNDTESAQGEYILNVSSKKFHTASCSSASSISAKNKDTFKGSRKSLIDKGYSPAGCCNP
ncbi:MAG: DNA/RNA non-specific endonuclease [Clostridia bacterium]|nr:DNA/RNA non-specific endonuclease [Clostridia bacterium]